MKVVSAAVKDRTAGYFTLRESAVTVKAYALDDPKLNVVFPESALVYRNFE